MKVAILGRGKVGRGLKRACRRVGLEAVAASGRGPQPRRRGFDLYILAVPDDAISQVAAELVNRLEAHAPVMHCAGARGPDELDALRRVGHPVGVLHPLASFPVGPAPPLDGATFALRGDLEARRRGRQFAKHIGAIPLETEASGPAYHAAAAMVANGAAALAWSGVRILQSLGMTERDGARALGGLLRTVGDNVAAVGVPDALSGPVLRGDVPTVRSHRTALTEAQRSHYDAVLQVIVDCAIEAGLDEGRANALRRLGTKRRR